MSKIEWTQKTWNPVRGCSRVSPGCDHCYAMGQAHRFSGAAVEELGDDGKPLPGRPLERREGPYHGLTVLRPKTAKRPGVDWSGRVRFVPEMLAQPLRWRKPQRVFVNSMSDLFHESLENEQILRVFATMAVCPHHTFQILTKRPARAAGFFDAVDLYRIGEQMRALDLPANGRSYPRTCEVWPLPNVWLGVSVEDRVAKYRIDELRDLPAAVRFLSIEPLLEDIGTLDLHDIDWVIVGGESGNGARPFDVDWAFSIVRQCRDAGVACFVKQVGSRPVREGIRDGGIVERFKLTDRKGGDMAEWPPELRVRQFPEARRG